MKVQLRPQRSPTKQSGTRDLKIHRTREATSHHEQETAKILESSIGTAKTSSTEIINKE